MRRWMLCALLLGCGSSDDPTTSGTADSSAAGAGYFGNYSREDAALIATLGRAAGGEQGQRYVEVDAGTPLMQVSGVVEGDPSVAGDSAVTPAQAPGQRCRPFRDEIMPRRGRGVGNAIVWLSGVTRGRPNDLSRRTFVRLNNCTLEPRVHIVAQGGTVMVGSHDAIESRLRLHDVVGDPAKPRAMISLNDFGQVVPDAAIAESAGLVEIRDDLHPWVRGYIAVSPHPYVTITDANGAFRLEGVPAGSYQLVVFSERFGVQRTDVRVDAAEVNVKVEFPSR